MANQFLGLSLFIMLLSFFIIMNSLSSFDEYKANPVLNSLTSAFSKKDETLVKVGDIPSMRKSSSKGTTISRINGLFKSHISGMEARQNRLGTELRLRLLLKDFENEVLSSLGASKPTAMIKNADGFFLETLVSLLDTQNEGEVYKMDMVAYTGQNVEAPQMSRDLAKKIAEITQKIERAGIPKKMLSSGVSSGPEGMIDIYFRPYRPFDPTSFKKGEGAANE